MILSNPRRAAAREDDVLAVVCVVVVEEWLVLLLRLEGDELLDSRRRGGVSEEADEFEVGGADIFMVRAFVWSVFGTRAVAVALMGSRI